MELSEFGAFVVVLLIGFMLGDMIIQRREIVKLKQKQAEQPKVGPRTDFRYRALTVEELARIEQWYAIVGFPVKAMRQRYPQHEMELLSAIERDLAGGGTLRRAFVKRLNQYVRTKRQTYTRMHESQWRNTENIDAFIRALNIGMGDEPVMEEQIEQHYHKAGRTFAEEIGL